MLLTDPSPHTEAAAVLSGKPVVTRRIFDQLLPELQQRAFTVTGVECLSTLQRVRDLAAQLPVGGDFDELKAGILDEISPWIITATDPDQRAKQMTAAVRRAELVLRNNGWAAYAVTNHRAIQEQADVFPFCQYLSSEDNQVRPTHAAINKKIFPTASPFWATHTPPWEHGCRCDKVPMMADEVDEIRYDQRAKPPEVQDVIEGAMLDLAERGEFILPGGTGKLDLRTPRQKTGRGYEFRPDDLALSFDDVLDRYDAPVADTFRKWAAATEIEPGLSVAEAFGGTPAKPLPPTGPAPAVPVPAAAAIVGPRTVDAIHTALDPLLADLGKHHYAQQLAASELAQIRSNALALTYQELLAKEAAAMTAIAEATAEIARLEDIARQAVTIPVAERGKVNLTPDVQPIGFSGKTRTTSKATLNRAQAGAQIVEQFTHKDLMPSVKVATLRGNRAFHRAATIHIKKDTDLSTVAHEITHATEQQNPDVIKAARAFLAKRAGSEPTKTLRRLTGNPLYAADERAWEDEWLLRGGSHYCGKDYGPRATELLTMGIERLYWNPLSFYQRDPEYFDFIIRTLQKL
jgi:SPP1 gp7 family putative phage head morphogenesis protein